MSRESRISERAERMELRALSSAVFMSATRVVRISFSEAGISCSYESRERRRISPAETFSASASFWSRLRSLGRSRTTVRVARGCAVLGAGDGPFFRMVYDATPTGNWEHKNILHRNRAPAFLSPVEEQRLASLRAKLKAVRDKRVWPGWDDKVLADWNGLMIAGLAEAGLAFERPEWIALAERAFAFIREQMTAEDGRLRHSWREGKAHNPATVDDYANLCREALALHGDVEERQR